MQQKKYFNSNKKELESKGVDVDEWNAASKGKKLPEHKNKPEIGMQHGIGINKPMKK